MEKNLFIDASHPNETRVVLKSENNIEDYEYESLNNTLIKNNAKHLNIGEVKSISGGHDLKHHSAKSLHSGRVVLCGDAGNSFHPMAGQGLNLGIDFKGGTVIEMQFNKEFSASKIRQGLLSQNLGDVKVKEFGSNKSFLAVLEKKSGESNFIPSIKSNLEKNLNENINFRRVEMVGPKISSELTKSGIYAVLLALVLMLFYIWLRFEWQFSLGSILALCHDVILTLGAFSLIGFEFNLSIIAAVLTIVGYSMNDTVVIYDRIRENLKKDEQTDLKELINISVNDKA